MSAESPKETLILIDGSKSFFTAWEGEDFSPLGYALNAAKDQVLAAKKTRGYHEVLLWGNPDTSKTFFSSLMETGTIKAIAGGLEASASEAKKPHSHLSDALRIAHATVDIFKTDGTATNTKRQIVIITDGDVYETKRNQAKTLKDLASLANDTSTSKLSFIVARWDKNMNPPLMEMLHAAGVADKVDVAFCKPDELKKTLAATMKTKPAKAPEAQKEADVKTEKPAQTDTKDTSAEQDKTADKAENPLDFLLTGDFNSITQGMEPLLQKLLDAASSADASAKNDAGADAPSQEKEITLDGALNILRGAMQGAAMAAEGSNRSDIADFFEKAALAVSHAKNIKREIEKDLKTGNKKNGMKP